MEIKACYNPFYDLYNHDDYVRDYWIRTWDNGYHRSYDWRIRGTTIDSNWDAAEILRKKPGGYNEYYAAPIIFVVYEEGVWPGEGEKRFSDKYKVTCKATATGHVCYPDVVWEDLKKYFN